MLTQISNGFHNKFHCHSRSSYDKVYKQLETCALVNKQTVSCIEILQDDVNTSKDPERVQSAYKSLVEIYMTCMNIERNWLPLFRKAFESVVGDQNIRDHVKVYIKYLKILRNLNDYEALLKSSIHMLELYPEEYMPMDMVCWVYVNKYFDNEFKFQVRILQRIFLWKVVKIVKIEFNWLCHVSISICRILCQIQLNFMQIKCSNWAHHIRQAMLLWRKASIYMRLRATSLPGTSSIKVHSQFDLIWFKPLHFTINCILFSANSILNEDAVCLRFLADTHLKLHAFTCAEYCYTKIKAVNLNYMRSLVEQNSQAKCLEALTIASKIENDSKLTDEERAQLTELIVK